MWVVTNSQLSHVRSVFPRAHRHVYPPEMEGTHREQGLSSHGVVRSSQTKPFQGPGQLQLKPNTKYYKPSPSSVRAVTTKIKHKSLQTKPFQGPKQLQLKSTRRFCLRNRPRQRKPSLLLLQFLSENRP